VTACELCGLTFELTPRAEAGTVSRDGDDGSADAGPAYSACRSESGVERVVRPHLKLKQNGKAISQGTPAHMAGLYLLLTRMAAAALAKSIRILEQFDTRGRPGRIDVDQDHQGAVLPEFAVQVRHAFDDASHAEEGERRLIILLHVYVQFS